MKILLKKAVAFVIDKECIAMNDQFYLIASRDYMLWHYWMQLLISHNRLKFFSSKMLLWNSLMFREQKFKVSKKMKRINPLCPSVTNSSRIAKISILK